MKLIKGNTIKSVIYQYANTLNLIVFIRLISMESAETELISALLFL